MSRRPTLAHRIEYALFAAATTVGKALPARAADALGAALGSLTYLIGTRRELAHEQVRLSFPDRDDSWVRATARGSYVHFGRELLALLRMGSYTREQILSCIHVPGLPAFEEAARAGKGLVMVTGHLGNWEAAAKLVVALGHPLDVVIQKQGNPLFNRALVQERERLGIGVIYKNKAAREALTSLRAGRVVAFVSDQDARSSGIFVPFFGRPASTARGPALLAVRTGAPLFLGYTIRAPSGTSYVGGVEEINVSREGDLDEVVERLTAEFTARLEQAIRRAPAQYFWQHRRWKTRPEVQGAQK